MTKLILSFVFTFALGVLLLIDARTLRFPNPGERSGK